MLILGIKTFADQAVTADGIINLGSIYRRYDKKCTYGFRAFEFNGSSVSLQQSGLYHITVTATFTAPVAGDVTIQLLEDGIAVPGISATETITTATTESRSIALDYYVLVDTACILGNRTIIAKTISLQNTGVASTITDLAINIDKVR